MFGGRGAPLHRFLNEEGDPISGPLPSPCGPEVFRQALSNGTIEAIYERFHPLIRTRIRQWVKEVSALGSEYDVFLASFLEVVSHFVALPPQGMMSPLPNAMDVVAVGLGEALGATGEPSDPIQSLVKTFQFLGGRFIDDSRFPIELESNPPPMDPKQRWQWFCQEAQRSSATAQSLWRKVMDPPQ